MAERFGRHGSDGKGIPDAVGHGTAWSRARSCLCSMAAGARWRQMPSRPHLSTLAERTVTLCTPRRSSCARIEFSHGSDPEELLLRPQL